MIGTCGQCRYMHAYAGLDFRSEAAHGECRRFPPTRTDIATPQGVGQISGWPTTKRQFGCGEFGLKLEVAS